MAKLQVVFDLEVYEDYFLASFMELISGNVIEFEAHPGKDLDREGIARMLRRYLLISFNGNHFDIPLLALALADPRPSRIKTGANAIIERGLKSWQFYDSFSVLAPKVDHIDLIEVAPGIASLKIYGGRLHSKKLQDLPIEPDASISPDQYPLLRRYCRNDLQTTKELYIKLQPQIALRDHMSEQYGIDLRSKSDAQIAEVVIASEVEKMTGHKVERTAVKEGTVFKYKLPSFISAKSAVLQAAIDMICNAEFVVGSGGKIIEPAEFKRATVKIGKGIYRLGIGGLHSSEKCVAHEVGEDEFLIDRDVASYYPHIITGQGLAPPSMGPAFLTVYKSILSRRISAKHAGDKVSADSLKLACNGSFGKLGSVWSKLYAPQLLIQTTITGQLALLMLIEAIEATGARIVSANTDGIVIRASKGLKAAVDAAVKDWEGTTGFETEETVYRALFSRDVNNYYAIKPDGSVKLKGAYAKGGLQKNPTNEVCIDAAIKWLRDGVAVRDTIQACTDTTKFVTIRSVKGGAVKGDQYLGRAVRWYYANGETGCMQYKVNGYTVPRSEGAKPLMDLPESLPEDIDYDWYVAETMSILEDVGALQQFA